MVSTPYLTDTIDTEQKFFFGVNNSVTMTPNQQLLYYTIINSLENVCFLSKQIEISCLWCQQTVLNELRIKQMKFEILFFNRISGEQKLFKQHY